MRYIKEENGDSVSFFRRHLTLFCTIGGVVLLLGMLTLVTLFLLYLKGKKVVSDIKTGMNAVQVYETYGSAVYTNFIYPRSRVTLAGVASDLRYYGLNQSVYIAYFTDKVYVLKEIYNKAADALSNLDQNANFEECRRDLLLIVLAAARELKYISSEVVSATKYNFLKERIRKLSHDDMNSRILWGNFGIYELNGSFISDRHRKCLVLSILIELNVEHFGYNTTDSLNNLVNDRSVRLDILRNSRSLLTPTDAAGANLVYDPDFPADLICNIGLGWCAFFHCGNKPFGSDEQRIYVMYLIRYRIVNLLNTAELLQSDLQLFQSISNLQLFQSMQIFYNFNEIKPLLEGLFRECKKELDALESNPRCKLTFRMRSEFQNYIKDNNDKKLSCFEFIEYCGQEPSFSKSRDISLQVKRNIWNEIHCINIDKLAKKLGLKDDETSNTTPIQRLSLSQLLSNKGLMGRLSFDKNDCEEISALFLSHTRIFF